MIELLPCPFCGNNDIDNDEGLFHHPAHGCVIETWEIRCGKPGCASIEAETQEECIRMWNTRAAIADPISTPRHTDCAAIQSGEVTVLARDAEGNAVMTMRKA